MKPQLIKLATRDYQELTPKGNRFTREINPDAYNVTNKRKERVKNRAGIMKKNSGQGTSKVRRYGNNIPKGSYASQMSGVAFLDPQRAAFCSPQPVRKRTSLESEQLPRREKSKSEDWAGTAWTTSPAAGRSFDIDSVPAQNHKKTTMAQDRCKMIKKVLKKLGKK